MVSEQVERIAIDKVIAAKDNIRSKVGDVTELAMSIKSVGILEPLVVCKRGKDYLVVAGARRLAAAELANETHVPAIVREYTEEQRLLAMAIENLQREDLSPLEEATAYQRLLDDLKISQRDLAPKVGKTQSHISKRVALLALPKDVQEKVDSGGITLADAVFLAKLADHPKELKEALNGPTYYGLAQRVGMQLAAIEREKKIVKLEQEIESKGFTTIRVAREWNLPKGVHRLKSSSNGHEPHVLQITPKQHEAEPCHAIAIDENGLGFPVCTNRKNHPKIKTQQETKSNSNGSTTAFREPKKTPEMLEQDARRTERLELVTKLIAKKPAKDALAFALAFFVADHLEMYEGTESLELAAVWLGLVDDPGDDAIPDADLVDLDARIAGFVAQGEAQLQRAALALAVATIDGPGYNGISLYLRDGLTRREQPRITAYLEFVRSQGLELGKLENDALNRGTPEAIAA